MERRPNPRETEDDLLQLQKEFLASKTAPSAKLVKLDKRKSESDGLSAPQKDVVSLGGLPQSYEQTSTAPPPVKKVKHHSRGRGHTEGIADPEEPIDVHDTHISKVISEIVERDVATVPVYFPDAATPHGFPTVLPLQGSQKTAQAGSQPQKKKKSLFAQQFASRSPKDFGVTPRPKMPKYQPKSNMPITDMVTERSFPSSVPVSSNKSYIVSGEGLGTENIQSEVDKIHQENTEKLEGLSQDEIVAEQKKLLESLDPSLVDFLKSKRQMSTKTATKPKTEHMDTTPPPVQTTSKPTKSAPKNKQSKAPPLGVDKKWVHMDKVEYDKLEWMDEVATPSPSDSATGKPARFDFQGRIVGQDADIPVYKGLHHHGDEPERAGYTLTELFQLARSANMQQRVMALTTIHRIIHNAKHGVFHDCTSTPVLPAMLDGGLIFIVRWALDDSTENTMAAAVQCLHSLLVTQGEEDGLDRVHSWYRGHEVPNRCSQEEALYEEEKDAQTDADVLKQDIVKGLIRMSLLPRLRYLLDKWRPASSVVVLILDILTRVAAHSAQAAYGIHQCTNLIETIVRNFLPTHWDPLGDVITQRNYGRPVPRAVRFMRSMCTAGRHLTAGMIKDQGLMERLSRYLIEDYSNLGIPQEEAVQLYLECLWTWKTVSSYGLGFQHFHTLYERLVTLLKSVSQLEWKSNSTQLSIGGAILSVTETILQVAAQSTINASRLNAMSREERSEVHETPALPPIDWSHVAGLFEILNLHMERVLAEFTHNYFYKKYMLDYTAACLNSVASYLSRVDNMPGYNAIEMLSYIEKLVEQHLIPCLKSQSFTLAAQNVRHYSCLLWSGKFHRKQVPPNMSELGALLGEAAESCPVLDSQSSVQYVLALTRLVIQCGRIHKGVIEKLYPLVVDNDEISQYVRRLCSSHNHAATANCFTKFEMYLQHGLLSLARHKRPKEVSLYHQMSLYLLVNLHQGDEAVVHDLLSTVLFNKVLLDDIAVEEIPSAFVEESLRISDEKQLTTAAQQTVGHSKVKLVDDILSSLSSVRSSYLGAMTGMTSQLSKSRSRYLPNPLETESLLTGDVGQTLMPVDWIFLPLVELYNKSVDMHSKGTTQESFSSSYITMVTSTLQWIYLVENWRSACLATVSQTLKISRLLCVFLAGSDLFLDPGIHAFMAGLLQLYCKPTLLDKLNFKESVPGISSFHDLYTMLLDQYEAVSFGDSLFGCFVLLPLQQNHSPLFRRAVWQEHTMVIRSLFIPVNQLLIPAGRFLQPDETNPDLIRLYCQALLSGSVSSAWCPVLYLVAVHHLNRYLFASDVKDKKLQAAMFKQILACRNEDMKRDVLHYKMADPESSKGITHYDELPANRRQILQHMQS